MRLDKMLCDTGKCTRREAAQAILSGKVTLNGAAVRDRATSVNPESDVVVFMGENIKYRRFTYIMLNKPDGVVSATEDGDKTVIDLLPGELQRLNLFPCGRLDKNTVGLVLLTNNGQLAHNLLAPKKHVSKSYNFKTSEPLSQEQTAALEAGVDIGGYTTKPCSVQLIEGVRGVITITEGKYHQIKLMMKAVGTAIVFLERISFGPLTLDSALARGEWRYLQDEEIRSLGAVAGCEF